MSKQFQQLMKRNPGMMLPLSFVLIAAVNAMVIWLANMLFPQNIVLGTISITPLWAVVLSASALSMLTVLVMPLLNEWEYRQGRVFKPMEIMAAYLVINFVFLWLITRISDLLGLGISSWLIVLVLAAVLDMAQGAVMMQVEKLRTQ